MKLSYTLFLMLMTSSVNADLWTPKANYTATTAWNICFSIEGKGYVGAGEEYVTHKDFWEFDPLTNVWTQKADYGGGYMLIGCSFSIGNYGYAGLGYDSTYWPRADFWEYNPLTNMWTQKADFGGGPRCSAFSFAVAGKGFIGGGDDGNFSPTKDLWMYNPVTDVWTQQSSMPSSALARSGTSSFVIGNKAYLVGGYGNSSTLMNEFWEYNLVNDTWLQKANCPFPPRSYALAFAICDNGYIGNGDDGSGFTYHMDFWQYDPIPDVWTQKTSMPGPGRMASASFVINDKAYAGLGVNHLVIFKDFYEYTPDNLCLTGIEENTRGDLQINLSPNPVKDLLEINYVINAMEISEAFIFDVNGRLVFQTLLPATKQKILIPISEFKNGFYFCRVGDAVVKFAKVD